MNKYFYPANGWRNFFHVTDDRRLVKNAVKTWLALFDTSLKVLRARSYSLPMRVYGAYKIENC